MSRASRARRRAAQTALATAGGVARHARAPALAPAPTAARAASIDAFRGLTILVMIFVNDLGSAGIPQWMRHMPANADAMTFVDAVFPAFLFIVGMAIPLAAARREAAGAGRLGLWGHAALRGAGLLVLGVYMVNQESFGSAGPLDYDTWSLLFYLAVILVWNAYPAGGRLGRRGALALRALGAALLALLAALYRGSDGGGMQTHWWGILGLIGWSYLICTALYELFARQWAAMAALVPLLALAAVGLRSEGLQLPAALAWLDGQAGHAVHAGITMAGLAVSLMVFGPQALPGPRQRLLGIAAAVLLLAAAGYLLRPLFGVSKIRATPSWGLYSAAWCCACFGVLYWLMDVRGVRRWARFVEPAASNPLLVYLLPAILFAALGALGVGVLDAYAGAGVPRMLRAALLSLALVALARRLERWSLRLRL